LPQQNDAPAASAPAETLADASVVAPAAGVASAPAAVPAAASGVMQVQVSADSWVGVVDASGRALLSRTVKPGEDIDLDGMPPFKVTIGNAHATKLNFRGKAVDLSGTRDNVARLELK
jgi:cytoskeleton protein RodZ